MAASAVEEYKAHKGPRTRRTKSVESTHMASLAAGNEGRPPVEWDVRCELYFFGDGVKSSQEMRGVSLGFQLKLNNIHGAARQMTVSDTVKMVTTIPE
jgi:hypothetical protein